MVRCSKCDHEERQHLVGPDAFCLDCDPQFPGDDSWCHRYDADQRQADDL